MKLEYRLTPSRAALLQIFSKYSKPLSAGSLLNLLTKKNVNVNKTTVYRELYFLISKGFINELYISNGKRYYESANLAHHHHLICNDCGMIEDVVLKNDLTEMEKKLGYKNNFKILNHSLEFFGLCSNCY